MIGVCAPPSVCVCVVREDVALQHPRTVFEATTDPRCFPTPQSFGIAGWTTLPFTSIVAVMPFLLVGVGVDDAFVIRDAFRRTDPNKPVVERTGESPIGSVFTLERENRKKICRGKRGDRWLIYVVFDSE